MTLVSTTVCLISSNNRAVLPYMTQSVIQPDNTQYYKRGHCAMWLFCLWGLLNIWHSPARPSITREDTAPCGYCACGVRSICDMARQDPELQGRTLPHVAIVPVGSAQYVIWSDKTQSYMLRNSRLLALYSADFKTISFFTLPYTWERKGRSSDYGEETVILW